MSDAIKSLLPTILLTGERAYARKLWDEYVAAHTPDEQYEFVEQLVIEAAAFGYDSA